MPGPAPAPSPSTGTRRLWVDCTATCAQPELMTGVQRVVHETVRRCRTAAPPGVDCIPVRFVNGAWRELEGGIPHRSALAWLRRRAAAARLRRNHARELPMPGALPDRLVGQLAYTLATLALSVLKRLPLPAGGRRVEPGPGDVLLLMDSLAVRPEVESAARAGARLRAVVYDIIPVTHPRFFVGGNTDLVRWFDWVSRHCDRALVISGFVADAFRRHYPAALAEARVFPLGADIPPPEPREPRAALSRALARDAFLMVGTVEPRKGHACALEAFERCWARGNEAQLVILGREGWMTEALMRRLRAHPELGRRLHVFHDADDAELLHAYRRARVLLAASEVEGFGLPLVEAGREGLPALAADIPVFREVAGESARYFHVNDPASLAEAIEAEMSAPARRLPPRPWPDWETSVRRLLAAAA